MNLKRYIQPLSTIFCLSTCLYLYAVLYYRASLLTTPSDEDHRLLYTSRRRYIRRPNLHILNRETVVHNQIEALSGVSDVLYAHADGSPLSMLNFVKSAVENGANWVFVPSREVNSNISSFVKKLNYESESTGLFYTGPTKTSLDFHFIYEHFQYPSDLKRSYSIASYYTPSIQTFYDAAPEKVKFTDHRAPPVAVPLSSLYSFTKQNTLYTYDAFWALAPLPVDDALWSLWVGRLMIEIENIIVFHAPPRLDVSKNIKQSTYAPDVRLLGIFRDWECEKSATFFTCVVDFSQFLKEQRVFDEKTVKLVVSWIQELLSRGYHEPVRATKYHKIHFGRQTTFWPSKGLHAKEAMHEVLNGICAKNAGNCKLKSTKKVTFDNILLVVVINMQGYYHVVDYMETLYGAHFPQRVYCGNNMTNFREFYTDLENKEITFMDLEINRGQFGYECIRMAHALKYDVDGYLHLSDDVMLNVWNLQSLPLDKPWFQHDMKSGKLSDKTVPDIANKAFWWPWGSTIGRGQVNKTFTELKRLAAGNEKIAAFFKTLAKNAGGKGRAFYQAADIHYVPFKMATVYSSFVYYFNKNRVHLEIAVPTIFNGLTNDIVRLPGKYLWHKERLKYKQAYKTTDVFLHPLKLASCLKNPTCYAFYCQKYLSCWRKV